MIKTDDSKIKGKITNHSRDGNELSKTVLRLIWKEHQISRADISKRLGLSRSTVTEIVKKTLKTNLVSETGKGPSIGGRQPIILKFQDQARGILGIDIGATHVSVVLMDLRGHVLSWKEERFQVRNDPEGTRKLILELCDASLASWKNGSKKILSIGVAVPSPVDPAHPEWLSEVVIPAWQGRNELEPLHKKYGVPLYIDNDANLGALAEYWWGSGKNAKNLIFIKISHGIGAGIILDGEIYRGTKGTAGELGHLPIDINGELCKCGLRGCLTTFLGETALINKVQSLLIKYPESTLNYKSLSVKEIELAALKGDTLAIRLVKESAEYMGVAISSLLNLLNPDTIVLGGSLAQTGDLFIEPIKKKIKQSALINSSEITEIKSSALSSKTIAIGAATLALQEAFSEPNILRERPQPGVL